MKFSTSVLLSALIPSLVSGVAIPEPKAEDAPSRLVKRAQQILSESVWRTTSSRIIMAVTPTVIDCVTISASPVTSSATPWVSLDSSGIPYLITPTVSDGTTISSSPTPTDTSYPTPSFVPPVLRCFGDRVPDSDTEDSGYPFCTGAYGAEMVVGETYWLTWDPTYWGGSDVTKVKIELTAYPQTGSGSTLLTTKYLSNADAFYPLTIESSFIRNGNGQFWVTITPLTTATTDATNVGAKNGPLLTAIASVDDASTTINRVPSDSTSSSSTSSSSSGSSNKAKTIAPAVVVPVVALLGIAAFVIWYLKKQRKTTQASGPEAQSGNGEIQLSPSSTITNDAASIITTTTNETQNPFKETSRTVL